MRRIPNFVLLRAFEAAARLQSFSLAARELNLTPSAISHQVKELEGVLGQPLFIRSHRRVELTVAGRRFYLGLAKALDALASCCEEVAVETGDAVLVVHCSPSLAVKWLGPRLPAFLARQPGTTIRLSTGAEPINLTQNREIDVAISYGYAREVAGVEVLPLGRERIVPLCSPALRNRRLPIRRQLADLPLIDSQLSQVTWPDWFALNGMAVPPGERASFDRAALVISAAVDGMGVALESTRLAERELSRGDLVELGPTVFRRIERETHFLSCRTDERRLAKVAGFKTWLFEQLAG